MRALRWFADNAGSVQGWPAPIEGNTLLATKAKGIYKPNWSQYALSVRQGLDSPYPDKPPKFRPDGTWSYEYFQENPDPTQGQSEFTNRALRECMQDGIPVGILRQKTPPPVPQYEILGLALVTGWNDGYFHFEGFSKAGFVNASGKQEAAAIINNQEKQLESAGSFDPKTVEDARQRILAAIVRRRGQAKFRKQLIDAYGGKCAITRSPIVETLEAAHIVPYRGDATNTPENGLLLRSDLHALFDLGMISIEAEDFSIIVSQDLKGSEYSNLNGKQIAIPKSMKSRPSKAALKEHRRWAGI
jgi:hypothetical protein